MVDLPKVLKRGEVEVDFIPKKILESFKELNIEPEMKVTIVEDVVRFIVGNNLRIITTPMIREIDCVMFLKHGYQIPRLWFTRIGESFSDLKKKIEQEDTIDEIWEYFDWRVEDKISHHSIEEFYAVKRLIKVAERG